MAIFISSDIFVALPSDPKMNGQLCYHTLAFILSAIRQQKHKTERNGAAVNL
jgi:hypothetical protein